MIRNKKLAMIVSLLIAIALWVYVAGTLDPVIKKSYNNVQVSLKNEARLEERGLAVSDCSVFYTSVTLSGKKSQVQKVDLEDIHATIDVGKLQEGKSECPIKIKVDGKAKVYEQEWMTANVTVEKMVAKKKPVAVEFRGTFDNDIEPTLLSLSKESVMIYGAKSSVDKVDHVAAIVDSSDMESGQGQYQGRLAAQDVNGQKVSNITIKEESVTVTAVLFKTKEVDLKVNVTGEKAGGYERNIDKPSKVTIKGPSDLVEKIEEVTAESVDVSKITSDTDITLKVLLPDGVRLSDENKTLKISITMDGEETKTFNIKSSDIEIVSKYDYEIEEKQVKITVKGKESVIKALSEKDIKLSVDLGSTKKEQVSAKIKCQIKAEINQVIIKPTKINAMLVKD